MPEIPESLQTPDTSGIFSEDGENSSTAVTRTNTENPTIKQLVSDYPDVAGWLTVLGAEISHPFVHADSNSQYLWTDLDGNYIRGGTLFMDCSNSDDFSDNITVIYGHNMRDGTMFGQLLKYLEFDYLLEHPNVYISFPDYTARYTVAACFVTDGADNIVFDRIGARDNIQDVVDFIYATTEVNPDTPLDGDTPILVLSTCHRSYETARTLLICVPY